MATDTSSLKTRSRASCSSVRSSTSSTGSAAAKARARAEAAKARLTFAEEEVNLKLQKARVEASMEMLQHKKEAAAAVAEAEALEAAIEENTEKHSCRLSLNSAPLEITQRTEQYVIDQTNHDAATDARCKQISQYSFKYTNILLSVSCLFTSLLMVTWHDSLQKLEILKGTTTK